MGTSRKRTREMKKLRGEAADIWGEQREVLGHSKQFWKEAGAEAASVAVNDVAPRVRAAIDNQVKPAVSSGVASATVAANAAKEHLVNDVAPAISSAVASGPLGDLAGDPTVAGLLKNGKKLSKKATRKALKKAAKQAAKHPRSAVRVAKVAGAARAAQKQHQKKSGLGAGKVFLIILGLIGLGAVVYAAVQTLRADDDLWVADDDDTAGA